MAAHVVFEDAGKDGNGMKEMDCFDRNRVRSEEEMRLLKKLRAANALVDCLLAGNIMSWLFSLVLAVALVLALNI